LHAAGDPEGAEQSFRTAVGLYEGLLREFPEQPTYHSGQGLALGNLALRVAGRDKSAAADLQRRALGHHRKALASNPRSPNYRRFLRTDCLNHADLLLDLGDHRGAADVSREAVGLSPAPADVQVRAAQLLSRCLDRAADEPDVPAARAYAVEAARLLCRAAELSAAGPTPPAAVIETYHNQAAALLRRAVDLGLDDPAVLRDGAFAPLRGRPDFAALLTKLTAPKGGRG
jgi:hypothetical protein